VIVVLVALLAARQSALMAGKINTSASSVEL
jgi:hypothetical protein